mgnify:CR=1 FL=1
MKKLYSLFALIALLFTASGCEDDYRSMVLSNGVGSLFIRLGHVIIWCLTFLIIFLKQTKIQCWALTVVTVPII